MNDDLEPADLDQVTDRLRALGRAPLPPGTRDRHLLAIRTADLPAATRAPRRWVRRRLAPITAGAVAMLLFGGGTVAVAQDAAPDDALYGIKRASEQAWVAFPRGADRAALVRLSLAERRFGEAARRPEHAERLVSEGVREAEAAAGERPEEAAEALRRRVERGLPEHASPRAHAALHRNCVKMVDKHDLDVNCGDAPPDVHPGRGQGRGHEGGKLEGKRGHGWGPGGRPDGAVGPPPGSPGRGEEDGAGDE